MLTLHTEGACACRNHKPFDFFIHRPGCLQSTAVADPPRTVHQPFGVTVYTWPMPTALAPPVVPRKVFRLLDLEARLKQAVKEKLADGDASVVAGTTGTHTHQVLLLA